MRISFLLCAKLCIFIFLFFSVVYYVSGSAAYANNISITNGAIDSQDAAANTETLKFDISWENSWRDSTNYDAAWVFLKYSTDGGTTWNHATLKTTGGGTNPSGFSRGTVTVGGASKNIDIVVPADNKGAFIQISSSDTGSGTLSATEVKFVWDYGADIASANKDDLAAMATLKVMAIEMAYIPQASFYAGDGTTENITGQFQNGSSLTTAFQITSENQLILGGTDTGNLCNNNANGMYGGDDFNNSSTQTLSASFPKGYNAFYVMKYELSQGQYRDFLNTLTRTQQAARVASTISADTITNVYVLSNPDPADPSPTTLKFRNGIRCPASGNGTTASIIFGCDLNGNGTFNEANDGEWIACNYLTWMDIAAYADWAALRPMTELELEKAARGPNAAVANEYAWGTTSITGATSISYSGRNNEVAGESGYGLCNYNNSAVQGPLRSGFAAGASTTRVDAGVGYYGAMDLSGNNWERVVTLGNSTGRSFTGSHGNGALSDSGHATNSDWPGYSIVNTAVTGATGSGFRGGDWMDPSTFIRVSSREYAAFVFSNRHQTHGARYCRTAP